MENLRQHLYEMEFYGFTLIEDVLSAEEVQDLKAALIEQERLSGHEQGFLGTASHVANLPALDPVFFPIVDHPKVLPVVEGVMGKEIILGSLNARIVRPTDPEQGLHSDIRQDLHNMAAPVMCNTVWMLDDFTTENGATRIVPGSHRIGLDRPPEDMEIKHVARATGKAGSVLVFNGQCWHGGGENYGRRNRHGLFGHYRKNALVFQVDPHDIFPVAWYDQLSDRQKELMRMTNGLGAPHASDAHFRVSFSSAKKKAEM